MTSSGSITTYGPPVKKHTTFALCAKVKEPLPLAGGSSLPRDIDEQSVSPISVAGGSDISSTVEILEAQLASQEALLAEATLRSNVAKLREQVVVAKAMSSGSSNRSKVSNPIPLTAGGNASQPAPQSLPVVFRPQDGVETSGMDVDDLARDLADIMQQHENALNAEVIERQQVELQSAHQRQQLLVNELTVVQTEAREFVDHGIAVQQSEFHQALGNLRKEHALREQAVVGLIESQSQAITTQNVNEAWLEAYHTSLTAEKAAEARSRHQLIEFEQGAEQQLNSRVAAVENEAEILFAARMHFFR
jgi:hypothetical protein